VASKQELLGIFGPCGCGPGCDLPPEEAGGNIPDRFFPRPPARIPGGPEDQTQPGAVLHPPGGNTWRSSADSAWLPTPT